MEYLSLLEECLRSSRNNQFINEALKAYGELSKCQFEALTDNYVEQMVLPEVIQRLRDPNLGVEDKMIMFQVLGQLSLGNLAAMRSSFTEIFSLYEAGFNAVAKLLREKVVQLFDSRTIPIQRNRQQTSNLSLWTRIPSLFTLSTKRRD